MNAPSLRAPVLRACAPDHPRPGHSPAEPGGPARRPRGPRQTEKRRPSERDGVTANFMFLTEGLLGYSVNLLLSSQNCQGVPVFLNLSKTITFAAAPLVLNPFVRNQVRRHTAPISRHAQRLGSGRARGKQTLGGRDHLLTRRLPRPWRLVSRAGGADRVPSWR